MKLKSTIHQPLNSLRKDLRKLADPVKASLLQGFFKTGKGQYGEGDKFLGIIVPKQREVAKKYAQDISLKELDILIRSNIHEERLVALLILVDKFERCHRRHPERVIRVKDLKIKDSSDALRMTGSQKSLDDLWVSMTPKEIYKFYLSHTKWINNWDLVDLSAPKIVGAYLRDKNKSILYKLAKSKNLWERRIAIVATFDFIYYGRPEETFKIAKMLMHDQHDLIHKAVGWMLREAGKRYNQAAEEAFLKKYYKTMPRTMLRYAIERFPPKLRTYYLS